MTWPGPEFTLPAPASRLRGAGPEVPMPEMPSSMLAAAQSEAGLVTRDTARGWWCGCGFRGWSR